MGRKVIGNTEYDVHYNQNGSVVFVSGDSGAANKATVPAGQSWEILGVVATITTTATAGNRTHVLRVKDATSVYYQTAAGSNLAASQSNASRSFLIGNSGLLSTNVFVPAGGIVDVFDSAAIDASNDTISIKLLVKKYISFD